jgi:hypothetical protein
MPIGRALPTTLVVTVVDSTGEGFVAVPYANVEVNGKVLVSSEEGIVRAKVDSSGRCVVRVRALGWEIQPTDTVALIGGEVRELRHVMQGRGPLVKY